MMKKYISRLLFIGFFLSLTVYSSIAQRVEEIICSFDEGLRVNAVKLDDGRTIPLLQKMPLFSVRMNGGLYNSSEAEIIPSDTIIRFVFGNGVSGYFSEPRKNRRKSNGILEIRNNTNDTVLIENVVPFGEDRSHVFITASGPASLTRARLFRPGYHPLGVILPDNAWELGYASVSLQNNLSVCGLTRRDKTVNGLSRRYQTILPPRSTLTYRLYLDVFSGSWQHGLKRMFHDHYLYDLDHFDESLYERPDLQWIKKAYIIVSQAAWDERFYNRKTGRFTFFSFLKRGEDLFGGYDVYALWPTWPRLGLDQRNQWQLYEDLPLGLPKLRELSRFAKHDHTRFFISYNPWDSNTEGKNSLKDIAAVIAGTDADGVLLDTRGSSIRQLQHIADSVKPGVIMYSEGMAVPKNMPGILAGRVHDAIFLSPPLNLNKLIRPDFAIFRVCQLSQGRLHREADISLFNGYGIEINTFAPGRPDWIPEEYTYLGKTTRILRENASVFLNNDWTPLVPSLRDSIWVNRWNKGIKTLYTVLCFDPEGYRGSLFKVDPKEGFHYVSLWHHRILNPQKEKEGFYLPVDLKSYPHEWRNTRREGSVDCLVRFPEWLKTTLGKDSLYIHAEKGTSIRLWKGNPSYQNTFMSLPAKDTVLNLRDEYRPFEGKYVIQLFEGDELSDEQVVYMETGKPYLISKKVRTPVASHTPNDMVVIPQGDFIFKVSAPDQFIPYPDYSMPEKIHMKKFFMDKYPVTNEQFFDFLLATHYKPGYPANFLKNWIDGKYPVGMGDYPVVWISLEDARAYAKWAKKRLPTEIEWQYAAQGMDERLWPWGDEFYGTRCNNNFDRPTPVDAFPKGKSPFKVEDMVGNVWQLTNDVYDNGSYYFVIIRGGSYFNPKGSQWYVKGGPQPLDRTQMLLMVSPGFDRCATVGFRCVKDAE